MCQLCDNPGITHDDYMCAVLDKIHRHGWMIQAVGSHDRCTCYTVGLTAWDLPELVMPRTTTVAGGRMLNAVAAVLVHGGRSMRVARVRFLDGKEALPVELGDGSTWAAMVAPRPAKDLYVAKDLYEPGRIVRARVLAVKRVWPGPA